MQRRTARVTSPAPADALATRWPRRRGLMSPNAIVTSHTPQTTSPPRRRHRHDGTGVWTGTPPHRCAPGDGVPRGVRRNAGLTSRAPPPQATAYRVECSELFGATHPVVGSALSNEALMLKGLGRYDEAIAQCVVPHRTATRRCRAVTPSCPPRCPLSCPPSCPPSCRHRGVRRRACCRARRRAHRRTRRRVRRRALTARDPATRHRRNARIGRRCNAAASPGRLARLRCGVTRTVPPV